MSIGEDKLNGDRAKVNLPRLLWPLHPSSPTLALASEPLRHLGHPFYAKTTVWDDVSRRPISRWRTTLSRWSTFTGPFGG
ncbi:hypothetical protein L227DRAFT_575591 [Lentinus tigrinus ALCF2SS1-6]|uniref:Uncharacterized protein n=1 Tax=Lentinus tigrinus ALCF2SS1-6 TaxID=1328759 RepID=A0A5C2SA98_9APHY|nr:hypothetical protein L227DRAFT_575591 [Lentinus tigrinus ALCF2SS1-6]